MTCFRGADLDDADLNEAKLNGTDFTRASLRNADVSDRQLQNSCCLNSTTLPSGAQTPALGGSDWWLFGDEITAAQRHDRSPQNQPNGKRIIYRGRRV